MAVSMRNFACRRAAYKHDILSGDMSNGAAAQISYADVFQPKVSQAAENLVVRVFQMLSTMEVIPI
ncbi:hypothetical protein A3747_14120 [Sulfitobacter sp. HI0076]|nr:hypothetical protein A3747_14120 [Sulfitobacter sp. HI0076]